MPIRLSSPSPFFYRRHRSYHRTYIRLFMYTTTYKCLRMNKTRMSVYTYKIYTHTKTKNKKKRKKYAPTTTTKKTYRNTHTLTRQTIRKKTKQINVEVDTEKHFAAFHKKKGRETLIPGGMSKKLART